jgi:hypothetical protein
MIDLMPKTFQIASTGRFTSGGELGMDRRRIADGADRFAAYVEELTGVIGHADRAAPLRDYCTGLLAAEARCSDLAEVINQALR